MTDATFEAEVLKSDIPVLVDFWAPWCGPCRMIAPLIDQLAEEYDGKLKAVRAATFPTRRFRGARGTPLFEARNISRAHARALIASLRVTTRAAARAARPRAPAPLGNLPKTSPPAERASRTLAYRLRGAKMVFLFFARRRV